MTRPLTPSDALRRRAARGLPRGFSLIESLIALLIFSLAVLGLVGLQVSLTRANSGAKFRADAAYLATDLIGTMWADAKYLNQYRPATCGAREPCRQWEMKLAQTLPGGSWHLEPGSASEPGKVTLTIEWTVPQEGTHSFTTTTSIVPNT